MLVQESWAREAWRKVRGGVRKEIVGKDKEEGKGQNTHVEWECNWGWSSPQSASGCLLPGSQGLLPENLYSDQPQTCSRIWWGRWGQLKVERSSLLILLLRVYLNSTPGEFKDTSGRLASILCPFLFPPLFWVPCFFFFSPWQMWPQCLVTLLVLVSINPIREREIWNDISRAGQ